MNTHLYFWMLLVGFSLLVGYFDLKFGMLRDTSSAARKPYSFARVQLAWWSVIVLTSFISIMTTGKGIPTLDASTLILLGISSATTVTARLVDVSDRLRTNQLIQNQNSDNFILDILSDAGGVSIHRFQVVAFNVSFGVWFLIYVYSNLSISDIELIIPVITDNNLVLLGLSSSTYAALKTNENKTPGQPQQNAQQSETVRDEAIDSESKAEG